MEAAALSYVRRGWAVLPLTPADKVPFSPLLPKNRQGEPSWKLLALTPATETEVAGWFRANPNINIGIICGSGLVVVDVDRPPGKPLHLPPTVACFTSRGGHYYFQSAEPVRTRKVAWGELRGEGSYVVAPPSKHPSGVEYRWADYCSPDDLEPAELPPDLLRVVEEDEHRQVAGQRGEQDQVTKKKDTSTRLPSRMPRSQASLSSVDVPGLFGSEEIAWGILRLCGVQRSRVGKGFRCPLPGHEEKKPSACLWRQEDGTFGLHDWHRKSGPEWFSLPEVFAAVRSGRVEKLGRAEQVTWMLRACVELGVLQAPTVMAPKLPKDAPAMAVAVYEGFKRLLAVRSLYDPGQDAAPYSWQFAADWCGRSKRHTGYAITWLLERGYIRKVQERGGVLKSTLFGIGAPETNRKAQP